MFDRAFSVLMPMIELNPVMFKVIRYVRGHSDLFCHPRGSEIKIGIGQRPRVGCKSRCRYSED